MEELNNVPDYKGLDSNKELVAQKSVPLLSLAQTELSLMSLKLLDAYLARIDSREPSKSRVRFNKGEFEALVGVKRIRYEAMDKCLKSLMQPVDIKGITHSTHDYIHLFSRARCDKDIDGEYTIDLFCTDEAKKYIFNVETIGYVRQRIKLTAILSSRYSYLLYLYLRRNCYKRNWEVPFDEIKEQIHCNSKSYTSYKRFSQLVLEPAQEELAEKTDIEFIFSPVIKKHKTVAVHFVVTLNGSAEKSEPTPMTTQKTDVPEKESENQGDMTQPSRRDPTIALMAEACVTDYNDQCEFTDEQLQVMLDMIVALPEYVLPHDAATDNIDVRRYLYLRSKYRVMLAANSVNPIKNRYAYLCKLIREGENDHV